MTARTKMTARHINLKTIYSYYHQTVYEYCPMGVNTLKFLKRTEIRIFFSF